MNAKIFINLPVRNLKASINFFGSLGYGFNQQFTDETATCVVISPDINVMLLTHEKFREFTPKSICDSSKCTEVLLSISCNSRAEVDDLVAKATRAGGKTYNEPKDYGFMYGHGFEDLDGHIWEVFYMEPAVV